MKRITALLLCILMTASVLSGCKKVVTSGTTTAQPGASAIETEDPAKEAETVYYEPKSTEVLLDIDKISYPSYKGVDENYQERDLEPGDVIATLHTNYGDISFRLFIEAAPLAVYNFVYLANAGRYDNTIFHRVIENFMIQGGDYTNFNGTGGESAYGTDFDNETTEYLSNITGAVAMANAGPNTNRSQFYINQVDNTYLDGGYTVFGQVYEGMDVVDAIASVKTDPSNDRPISDVVLESVEVSKYQQ